MSNVVDVISQRKVCLLLFALAALTIVNAQLRPSQPPSQAGTSPIFSVFLNLVIVPQTYASTCVLFSSFDHITSSDSS